MGVNTAAPFAYAITVDPADIDFMGHVNNASYLRWVQDAVVGHWRTFAPAQAIADHVWVATNHNITYRRPTFLNDPVIAHVILERVQGARAFYETIIKRGEEVIGSETKVKVVKNKVSPPFREAIFDILYGEGISRHGEIVELGVAHKLVEKSGAWFSYDSIRIGQGRENAKTYLRENKEVCDRLEAAIRGRSDGLGADREGPGRSDADRLRRGVIGVSRGHHGEDLRAARLEEGGGGRREGDPPG